MPPSPSRTASATPSGPSARPSPNSQKPEGGSIKHDVAVPVSQVPRFLAEADAAVARFMPGARFVSFGHLGDGNIHYNVSQPVGMDKPHFLDQWNAMNDVVFEVVAASAARSAPSTASGGSRRTACR